MEGSLSWIYLSYVSGLIAGSIITFPDYILLLSFPLLILPAFTVKYRPYLSLIFVCLSLIPAGISSMGRELNKDLDSNYISYYAGRDKELIEGYVFRKPEKFSEDTVRIYIKARKLIRENEIRYVKGGMLVYVRQLGKDLFPGDIILIRCRIKRIEDPYNPGQFNQRLHYLESDIVAKGYIDDGSHILKIGRKRDLIPEIIETVRERLRDLYERSAKEKAPIYKALILGERDELDEDIKDTFYSTGTGHILAISGLHIGIIGFVTFLIFYFLLKRSERLMLLFDIRKIASFLSLPFILFYVVLSGASYPSLRAGIMAIFILFAFLLNRDYRMYNALAMAGLIINFIDPLSIFSASFQLSFVAVLSIVYFKPRIDGLIDNYMEIKADSIRLLKIMKDIITLTIAATVGVTPIVSYYFHRFPLYSIFANIVAVPLMGFIILPLMFFSSLLTLMSEGILSPVFLIQNTLLEGVIRFLKGVRAFPYSTIITTIPTIFEIMIYYLFAFSIFNIKSGRKYIILFCISVLLTGGDFVYWFIKKNYNKNLTVTFFHVGHGDSCFIEFPGGKRMMIDWGGGRDSGNTGEFITVPFLLKNKIMRIDYGIITHPQMDHWGGIMDVMKYVDIRELWITPSKGGIRYENFIREAGERGVKVIRMKSGDVVLIDSVRVEILNPPLTGCASPLKYNYDYNNCSLVMRITYGKRSFLFTADIERDAQQRIMKTFSDLKTDVLKVPHHGYPSGFYRDFLMRVKPSVAIINNSIEIISRYTDTLESYKSAGADLIITGRDGAAIVWTDGESLGYYTFRNSDTRIVDFLKFSWEYYN